MFISTLQRGQLDCPPLAAAWEAAAGFEASFADVFGDSGGVLAGDVIIVDAELKREEPKPNIFPVTDSSGFVASG